MLGQRRTRWPNIEPTRVQRLDSLQASTVHCSTVVLMLYQRRGRWPDIKTMVCERSL